MTIVLNDPSLWPLINFDIFHSYFVVATFIGVTYDWALTFGQEVELIWRQRWSIMTVLYIGVRYLGIVSAILNIMTSVPTIFVTDAGCYIIFDVRNWMGFVVNAMLWVIIITRLHAMYQGSRKILIFLIITFLAANIFSGIAALTTTMHFSGEEFIISGAYLCSFNYPNDTLLLASISWILGTVWEVFALCLAAWIAVKRFRELRRYSSGAIMSDYFAVLMKTHILYFASFSAASCFTIIVGLSPAILADPSSLASRTCYGLLQIFSAVQPSVLGPRLILDVREHAAKPVADPDTATAMTSIAFQERVHISTGNGV